MPHCKKTVQTDRYLQEKPTVHFSTALTTKSEINFIFNESVKIIYVHQLTKLASTGAFILLEWAGSVTIEVDNILPSGIVVE